MAYGRFRRYRRPAYRRPFRGRRRYRRGRGGSSYWNTATRALKLARSVYGMLNVEYKKVDATVSTQIYSSVPYTGALLGAVAQGAGATQRNGAQLEWKNFYLEGHITRNSAATDVSSIVRVVIAYIHQNELADNSALIFSDCYASSDVNALRDLDHTGDWTVLVNKEYVLTNDRPTVNMKLSKKFLNDAMKYKYDRSATSGGATSIEDKMLYIGVTTSTVQTNSINLDWNVRGTFIDN